MYDLAVILAKVHAYLSAAGLSENTRNLYAYFLRYFFDWFRQVYPHGDVQNVVASTVTDWFATHPNWTSSTMHNAAAAIREFYRFYYGENHPATRFKVRKIDPGPQRTLDKDELSTLLAAIDTQTERGIRDLAIVTLMADTGMRASEICNLELDNLDLNRNRLSVLTKGGKWQEKLFFDYTAACIKNWLELRETIAGPGITTVFVSIGGREPGKRLTKSGIRYLYDRLSSSAHLKHINPHAMRRTFATLAIENGAPTRVVQIAGGWQSIRMVERYTRALRPDSMRQYSPINHVMGVEEKQEKEN